MTDIMQPIVTELWAETGKSVLTYRVVGRPCKVEGAEGRTEYGVRVERIMNGGVETAEAPGISCDGDTVRELCARLAAGRVMPLNLMEIVDDFLAQS